MGFVVALVGGASAQDLTAVEKDCAKTKVWVTTVHFHCLSKALIKGIKNDLLEYELNQLVRQCEVTHARRFEWAEARAAAQGETCATIGDSSEVHQGLIDAVTAFPTCLNSPNPCCQDPSATCTP